MRGVRLASGRIAHLLGVAVVCGDQQLSANGFNGFAHFVNAAIQRFYCFNGGFHHPGVANHIAVRVVTDDGVELTALDGGNQFFGQLSGAHFRLQIVGCDLR